MAATHCTPRCHLGAPTRSGEDGAGQQGLRVSPEVSCSDGCQPAFTVAWLCLGADNVDWRSGFAGNTYQPLRIIDPSRPAKVQVTATVTVSCAPDQSAAQCSTTWLVGWEAGAVLHSITELDSTCPGT